MKKGKILKEIRELGIVVTIIGILYFTGLHTEVAAFAQKMILQTGLMSGDEAIPKEEREMLDYNLSLVNPDGERVSLMDYKDKVLFINLWATWCPPCIAEMPGIQELYDDIDNEDIVFIMLSTDDSMEKVKTFIEKKGYSFPVYMPSSRVPDVLRSPSIPTTFVVNKKGEIVSKKVGMAKYNTKSFKKFLLKQVSDD